MDVPKGLDGLVVAKVGSSTIVNETGEPDRVFISALIDQICTLRDQGYPVVLVSSGAAAIGRVELGFSSKPQDIPSLQACASAGQAALTDAYAQELKKRNIPCGQVLITRRDVIDREGYLNARNTFFRLLELGAVPIVNENDTVSVSEFTFSDNDMLGAIVSALLGASLYVILSDVDGLYTANPATDKTAKLIRHVAQIDDAILAMAGDTMSSVGTGGMRSKLRAARATLAAGIPTVICEGRGKDVLVQVVQGQEVGTRFEAAEDANHESGRKLWIGLAEVAHGRLTIDRGARRALVDNGASLLPVGITKTEGTYREGDVVDVVDSSGFLIARGVARYSSEDMVRVRGLQLDVIARFMPEKATQPAIHRDELLVF